MSVTSVDESSPALPHFTHGASTTNISGSDKMSIYWSNRSSPYPANSSSVSSLSSPFIPCWNSTCSGQCTSEIWIMNLSPVQETHCPRDLTFHISLCFGKFISCFRSNMVIEVFENVIWHIVLALFQRPDIAPWDREHVCQVQWLLISNFQISHNYESGNSTRTRTQVCQVRSGHVRKWS